MASFEVIPPVSRSPMQCFWSKCSPLALAMAWCAPDNIYWGRKLRGAAKTRGWCRTTSDPPSPTDCCNIALGFKEHIQWKQILQLGFITFFVNRLPDQTESRSWIRKLGGKVNIIIYHFTLSNTDGGINNFVTSNYLQNLAFEKHRYNSGVLKLSKYSKISKIYLHSDFGCINWHHEKLKKCPESVATVAVYLMTSSTVVSSEIKRHLYFSSATCRHMSY